MELMGIALGILIEAVHVGLQGAIRSPGDVHEKAQVRASGVESTDPIAGDIRADNREGRYQREQKGSFHDNRVS